MQVLSRNLQLLLRHAPNVALESTRPRTHRQVIPALTVRPTRLLEARLARLLSLRVWRTQDTQARTAARSLLASQANPKFPKVLGQLVRTARLASLQILTLPPQLVRTARPARSRRCLLSLKTHVIIAWRESSRRCLLSRKTPVRPALLASTLLLAKARAQFAPPIPVALRHPQESKIASLTLVSSAVARP